MKIRRIANGRKAGRNGTIYILSENTINGNKGCFMLQPQPLNTLLTEGQNAFSASQQKLGLSYLLREQRDTSNRSSTLEIRPFHPSLIVKGRLDTHPRYLDPPFASLQEPRVNCFLESPPTPCSRPGCTTFLIHNFHPSVTGHSFHDGEKIVSYFSGSLRRGLSKKRAI